MTGALLLVLGLPRLPGVLIDIPGNPAAEDLGGGRYVNTEGLALVLETRRDSLAQWPNAERWFAVGRASLATGNAEQAADAFAGGLLLSPANGVVWAEYARALDAAGRPEKAGLANAYSVERAPHDPVARRLRRR